MSKELPFKNFKGHFDFNVDITDDKTLEAEYKKRMAKLKTGTTTVGLVCKDGVCLATDKRATMGSYIANKNAEKLHMIQPNIWMTIAGGVADAQYLIDLLRAETNIYNLKGPSPITVKGAATLLSNILYQKKGFYEVGHILGGMDVDGGGLFDLGGYGSILPDKYCSVGSGSGFAIGVLEAKWREDLTVEEGMKICAIAVRSAIIRDIASGNGIDVVGIKIDSFERKFFPITKDILSDKK
ncbi:MAG: proteasome subunit beta [archaeon]|nr:proteasome subunit beta [archaeon]